MRKSFKCIYICPNTGEEKSSIVEGFFLVKDINSQVETYFETRIAPLKTLTSFKEI